MRAPVIEQLFVDDIKVGSRRRDVSADKVAVLADSIAKIGLRTPITIRSNNDSMALLVAGAHRLEAVKRLGWEKIDCIVLDCDEVDAELWEIAENLHRAELTVLERGEQIGRWVALSKQVVLRQVDAKPQGGRPESGARRAARELNITEPEARRAVKIANLSEEAKQAARDVGLDDNQKALLEAAKVPLSQQAQMIRARAVSPPSNYPQDDHERSLKWRRAFERVWNDAPSLTDREWAKDWIDRPIMDGAAA